MNRLLLGSVMAGAVASMGCAGQIIVRDVDKERTEFFLEKEKVTVVITESSCVWEEEPKKFAHLSYLHDEIRISTNYIDEKCDGQIDRIFKHVYRVENAEGNFAKTIDLGTIERDTLEQIIKDAPTYGSWAQFYKAVDSNKVKPGRMSTVVELYLDLKRWDSRSTELMKKYELQEVREHLLKK